MVNRVRVVIASLLLVSAARLHERAQARSVTTFGDVPCSNPFAPWIDDPVARSITAGCGLNSNCPLAPALRQPTAVFLVKTFNLPF